MFVILKYVNIMDKSDMAKNPEKQTAWICRLDCSTSLRYYTSKEYRSSGQFVLVFTSTLRETCSIDLYLIEALFTTFSAG